MTNNKKKELAQKLYVSNFFPTQKELAEYLETSEQTISKWVKTGKWDDLKESFLATHTEELAFLYRQLRLKREELEASERKTYNNSDMDVISKLTASIRNLKTEKGIEDVIDVSIMVLDWVRNQDIKKAQLLSEVFNSYIKAHA